MEILACDGTLRENRKIEYWEGTCYSLRCSRVFRFPFWRQEAAPGVFRQGSNEVAGYRFFLRAEPLVLPHDGKVGEGAKAVFPVSFWPIMSGVFPFRKRREYEAYPSETADGMSGNTRRTARKKRYFATHAAF